METGNLTNHGQAHAEPPAGVAQRTVGVAFKEVGNDLLADALAVVPDFDKEVHILPQGRDGDGSAFGRKVDGVGDQVIQGALQQIYIHISKKGRGGRLTDQRQAETFHKRLGLIEKAEQEAAQICGTPKHFTAVQKQTTAVGHLAAETNELIDGLI